MNRDLLLLAAGWAPLWLAALWRRRDVRPGRVLFGALLVGFVGGMCSVELRRHGLISPSSGDIELPVVGVRLGEAARFALIGAAGAVFEGILLSKEGRRPEAYPDRSTGGEEP